VLFEKIASAYLFEKYIYISALEMASPGNQNCASNDVFENRGNYFSQTLLRK